jgi:hypothetical protein
MADDDQQKFEIKSKPNVNFTGDMKNRVKPKKEDNFFDDPIDVSTKPSLNNAKPDFMKSRLPSNLNYEERKTKEKNPFDDDYEEEKAGTMKMNNPKPNLGKMRINMSTDYSQYKMPQPKKEETKDPYNDFEVLECHQEDDFEDVNAGTQIKISTAKEATKQGISVSDYVIERQMSKVYAVKQLIRFEIEKNNIYEMNASSTAECNLSLLRILPPLVDGRHPKKPRGANKRGEQVQVLPDRFGPAGQPPRAVPRSHVGRRQSRGFGVQRAHCGRAARHLVQVEGPSIPVPAYAVPRREGRCHRGPFQGAKFQECKERHRTERGHTQGGPGCGRAVHCQQRRHVFVRKPEPDPHRQGTLVPNSKLQNSKLPPPYKNGSLLIEYLNLTPNNYFLSEETMTCVLVHQDSGTLVSGDKTGTLRLFTTQNKHAKASELLKANVYKAVSTTDIQEDKRHRASVQQLAITETGEIFSLDKQGRIISWQIVSKKGIPELSSINLIDLGASVSFFSLVESLQLIVAAQNSNILQFSNTINPSLPLNVRQAPNAIANVSSVFVTALDVILTGFDNGEVRLFIDIHKDSVFRLPSFTKQKIISVFPGNYSKMDKVTRKIIVMECLANIFALSETGKLFVFDLEEKIGAPESTIDLIIESEPFTILQTQ